MTKLLFGLWTRIHDPWHLFPFLPVVWSAPRLGLPRELVVFSLLDSSSHHQQKCPYGPIRSHALSQGVLGWQERREGSQAYSALNHSVLSGGWSMKSWNLSSEFILKNKVAWPGEWKTNNEATSHCCSMMSLYSSLLIEQKLFLNFLNTASSLAIIVKDLPSAENWKLTDSGETITPQPAIHASRKLGFPQHHPPKTGNGETAQNTAAPRSLGETLALSPGVPGSYKLHWVGSFHSPNRAVSPSCSGEDGQQVGSMLGPVLPWAPSFSHSTQKALFVPGWFFLAGLCTRVFVCTLMSAFLLFVLETDKRLWCRVIRIPAPEQKIWQG